jgi:hypothetical protein
MPQHANYYNDMYPDEVPETPEPDNENIPAMSEWEMEVDNIRWSGTTTEPGSSQLPRGEPALAKPNQYIVY